MKSYVPIVLFGLGIASVVAPMVSQALRARDFRGVRHTVRQGFWLTLLFGAIFTAVIWHGRPLLLATGPDPALAALSDDYLQELAWGLVTILWFVVLRCFAPAHAPNPP